VADSRSRDHAAFTARGAGSGFRLARARRDRDETLTRGAYVPPTMGTERVAVIVNLNARRGSPRIAGLVRRLLPRAKVAITSSLEDARRFLRDELAPSPPTLLLSGGGDGTATALINELRALELPLPTLGLLPLGTGNGLANVTRAPEPLEALRRVAALDGAAPPSRTFALVDVEGRAAPFAGTGWDAQMVADFREQLHALPEPLRVGRGGLRGYLHALFTRTIPRSLRHGAPRGRLYNLGDDALTVDPEGRLIPIPGVKKGSLLYEGPINVGGAATTPEWGFGFRAFPFAQHAPGRLSVRAYGAHVLQATGSMLKLWRGEHPLPHMHDFFVTRCRFEFDHPVPFQIGGDLVGERKSIELGLAETAVELVDWSRLRAA
jgi:diacylglycerol kinase family enzyme